MGRKQSSDKRKIELSVYMLPRPGIQIRVWPVEKLAAKEVRPFHKTEHGRISSGHNILQSDCFPCTSKSQNISQWTTYLQKPFDIFIMKYEY